MRPRRTRPRVAHSGNLFEPDRIAAFREPRAYAFDLRVQHKHTGSIPESAVPRETQESSFLKIALEYIALNGYWVFGPIAGTGLQPIILHQLVLMGVVIPCYCLLSVPVPSSN